jgi:AcrR family transcriptional regulator
MNVANTKTARWTPPDNELTARRQEEILAAASKFFAEHGYPNADLQLLANQLGIGKGTLYRYFPSKEELFLAAVDRGVRQLHAYVDARCTENADPLDYIYAAVRSFFAFFDANPDVVELLIQERAEFRNRREPTYFKHHEANIGPWDDLTRGLIDKDRIRPIHIKRIGDKISNMLYGTLFTNYFMRRNESFEDQSDDVLEVIMLGILSDKERANKLASGKKAKRRNGGNNDGR